MLLIGEFFLEEKQSKYLLVEFSNHKFEIVFRNQNIKKWKMENIVKYLLTKKSQL